MLSTDATGAAIQPGPREGGPKRACKKGHFFTIVADCDSVLFAYTEKHTQLRRVFLDGRIPLDNTRSERALRKIVVGRKNWMFYGSDLHADAAAAIFSIIATCRLHGLDPWKYLDEVLRVLPYWPKERHLELAPKFWAATRARLDAVELMAPVGVVTVPPVTSA